MIVLDLEWNQPFGGRRMEEIIQIGAVRLAEPGGAVQDWFNMHIRPSIYPKLSPVARKLPESAQALTAELDFPAAYQAFLDWCGDDTLWAEWGAQDHGVLAANAAYWRMPEPPVTACVDLQAAFGRTLGIGIGRRVALEQAAEYCGIPLIYEFHNALYDALYAALVSAWLTKDALAASAPPPSTGKPRRRRSIRFSPVEYPRQPRQKVGVFPEREQVLNSRQARLVPCPLCRTPGAVESWYPQGDVFYGTFRCQEHGRFPVRMSVTRQKDGWQGRRVVPTLTEPERAAFAAAHQHEPFQCRREKAKRRKRHRKKGKGAEYAGRISARLLFVGRGKTPPPREETESRASDTGRTEASAPTKQNRNRAKRDVEDAVPYRLCHCEERSDAAIRSPQPEETDSRAGDTVTGAE